jgi:probable rRNA maturation factor
MGREGRMKVLVSGESALPQAARRASLYEKAVRLAFKGKRIDGEVSVVFLTRAEMLRMNRHYLGHDYDTDVISFQHDVHPGMKKQRDVPIGDIFISAWMAVKQAKELGHSVSKEAATLAIHGALHLLGHDDHAPAKKKRMFAVQDRLVAELDA